MRTRADGGQPGQRVLAAAALIIGLLIAVPAGIISALRPGSKIDVFTSVSSQIGVAIPDFWMGIMLILLFSLTLGWLPARGYTPIEESFPDWLRHIILPAVTLGIISGAVQTRFVRSAMLEVLNENYIRTARAKGLAERAEVARHALRNALIPVITVLGPIFAGLVTGTFVTETIFGIPGLGRYFITSVTSRDYPVIMGTALFFAVVLVLANLFVDLAYAWLDPRIEYE